MVSLSQLCEPSRRGNRVNWDADDNDDDNDDDKVEKLEEALPLEEESIKCPTDVCIICCGLSRQSASNPPPHKFPSKRKDSLRRHLIDIHLALAHEGISCTWAACRDVPAMFPCSPNLLNSWFTLLPLYRVLIDRCEFEEFWRAMVRSGMVIC